MLVCYVAYLLWVAVRRRLREAKIRLSPEKAMLQLRRVEMVKFRVGEKEKWDCPKAVGEGARLEKVFALSRWKAVVAN